MFEKLKNRIASWILSSTDIILFKDMYYDELKTSKELYDIYLGTLNSFEDNKKFYSDSFNNWMSLTTILKDYAASAFETNRAIVKSYNELLVKTNDLIADINLINNIFGSVDDMLLGETDDASYEDCHGSYETDEAYTLPDALYLCKAVATYLLIYNKEIPYLDESKDQNEYDVLQTEDLWYIEGTELTVANSIYNNCMRDNYGATACEAFHILADAGVGIKTDRGGWLTSFNTHGHSIREIKDYVMIDKKKLVDMIGGAQNGNTNNKDGSFED